MKNKLYYSWLSLKIIYGIIVLIAGIDKFLGLLNPHSESVISNLVKALIPVKILYFIYGVGIFEIITGIMILTHCTYWGALLLMAWYLIIDINLCMMGIQFYTLILSNLGHAAANFALAQLTAYLNKK